MRAFSVKLPSGLRYWTVIDENLRVVSEADAYLRNLRFGRDASELTTKAYAGSLALFLRWCHETQREWEDGVKHLGLFVVWLRYSTVTASRPSGVMLFGPGHTPTRGTRRINGILAAVRGFVAYSVISGEAPPSLMSQIYELADERDLPDAARSEDGRMIRRMRALHRLNEPENPVNRASNEEIVALVKASRSARDRLIILLMARAGLRRGELVGLRRSDMHLLEDSRQLGCDVKKAHLHVLRRDNPNGAWAKSRRHRAVPVDPLIVQAFDAYEFERLRLCRDNEGDFVLVNLFAEPIGAPMRLNSINELMTACSKRAGLSKSITPHQLRHAFGSNVVDAGGTLDEVAELLGHASMSSSEVYLHPDPARLREAVERVPSPRFEKGG